MTYGDWQDIEKHSVDTSGITITNCVDVASPFESKGKWRRKYALEIAKIMNNRDPSGNFEVKSAYKVAADAWRESKIIRRCGVELLDAQLEHYANGGGERFRKPDKKGNNPTPFWILNALEDDLPKLYEDVKRQQEAFRAETERQREIERVSELSIVATSDSNDFRRVEVAPVESVLVHSPPREHLRDTLARQRSAQRVARARGL